MADSAEAKEMTLEEAEVHLHNLAHSFMAPMVMLTAYRKIKEAIDQNKDLVKESERLRFEHDRLRGALTQAEGEAQRLEATRIRLTTAVESLKKQYLDLTKALGERVTQVETGAI